MAKRIQVLAATVSGLLGAACGGGGGGGAGGGAATNQSAFINQYCDVFRPCCAATGRPADGATCRSTLTTFPGLFLAATYNQAAGDTCLAAFREAAKLPGFCENSKDRPIACAPALGQTGTLALGAACGVTNDCAPSPEGRVDCFRPNNRNPSTTGVMRAG